MEVKELEIDFFEIIYKQVLDGKFWYRGLNGYLYFILKIIVLNCSM